MRSHLTPGATSVTAAGAGGAACGKLRAAVPPSWGLMKLPDWPNYTRSKMAAMPWPTPMHMEASA